MSITLTTPTSVTITGTQSVSETDSVAVITAMNIDYKAETATFVFQTGKETSGTFVQGQYGFTVTLTIHLDTGAWASFDSRGSLYNQAGNVAGASLTAFINQLISDANLVEQFAAATFLPGTQVAFTPSSL
jgi:hypothetical protein